MLALNLMGLVHDRVERSEAHNLCLGPADHGSEESRLCPSKCRPRGQPSQPRNPVGWILLADDLLWTTTGMLDNYNVYGIARPGSLPFPLGAAAINNLPWAPSVGLLANYVFLLFPDGRLPSRRWRPLAWLSWVVIASVSVGVALSP